MNTMQTVKRILCCGCAAALMSLPALSRAEEQTAPKNQEAAAPQQESKWSEAGRNIKGAAGSVAEATKETTGAAWDTVKNGTSSAWEKTKSGSRELYEAAGDKSKEAWQTTKEESKSVWEKGKSLIHEATAPAPPVAPYAPAAPASQPPPAAPKAEQ